MSNENGKRNRSFVVRLTEKEMLELNAKVSATKLKREAYVRQVLLGTIPNAAPSVSTYETVRQLSKIGNNINQIARVANSVGTVDTKKLDEELDELHQIFSELKGRL